MRLLQIKLTGTKEDVIKGTKIIESICTVELIDRMSGIIKSPSDDIYYRFIDIKPNLNQQVEHDSKFNRDGAKYKRIDDSDLLNIPICPQKQELNKTTKKWWRHFSFRQ